MIKTSGSVTIFEGVDGSGKSTIARFFAQVVGARYVHCGPFGSVHDWKLASLYVEAMMPAILGYQDVVLDRCWISEVPYGRVFRGGLDRIKHQRRLLERLAYRCRTKVFLMDRPFEDIRGTFASRRPMEMLGSFEQLRGVYDWYDQAAGKITQLPVERLNTTPPSDVNMGVADYAVMRIRTDATPRYSRPHQLDVPSAGNMMAPVLLVGERFGPVKGGEPLYQWPFGGLSPNGCSSWLSARLDEAGISESVLLWINADASDEQIRFLSVYMPRQVIALGRVAHDRLESLKIPHYEVQHPQYRSRFHSTDTYDLIDSINAAARLPV